MGSIGNKLKQLLTVKTALVAALLLGFVILIIVGFRAGWWIRLAGTMGGWFWALLLFFLIATGLVLFLWLLPRYRERRFLEQMRAEEAQAPSDQRQAHDRALRGKLLEAVQTLENSPDLKRQAGLPLYALPWYLLIGDSQAGKTTLLRAAANHFTPFVQPTSSPDDLTATCDWWFFNTAIILDTPGRYTFPAPEESDPDRWSRFLRLLRHYRNLQPINGLIVAVGADALASKTVEQLRHDATGLRTHIDKAIQELGVEFPVYLLITRCDLLEGFTEFFGYFPEATLTQVFGYMQDVQSKEMEAVTLTAQERRFESMMETLAERLRQLRLAIYNDKDLPPPEQRQQIHCFPEEFSALRQPLSVFANTLFAENPYTPTPFFRGLFLSSAQQQGTPLSFLRRQFHLDGPGQALTRGTKPYFLHDLFAVVLPRDQYLVKPTRKARKTRLLKHLFSLTGFLALGLFAVIFLSQAFLSDRRVRRTIDQTLCRATVAQTPGEPLLDEADRCRQMVQTLQERNRRRFVLSRAVFNRSGRVKGQLHQQYVEKFTHEVLAPLDMRIGEYLTTGSETIPLVLVLIKRIELINQCLSLLGCPEHIDEKNQPEYRLMLDPTGRHPPTAAQIDRLKRTYETYLRWGLEAKAVLHQKRNAQAERLQDWFSAKGFAPQQIVRWANASYPPLALNAYWETLPPTDSNPSLQVEGAYTPAAWSESIQPFLTRAGDAVPGMAPLLKAFKEEYRAQYFEQWQHFLAVFPQGELPWWQTPANRRRLAVKLLDENSPYNRIPNDTFKNLKPFLPQMLAVPETGADESADPSVVRKAWQAVGRLQEKVGLSKNQEALIAALEADIPAWVRVLRRFIGSESRHAYLGALAQIGEQLADDPTREKSFELAKAGFQEGKPSEQSTHPVLKAWWIVREFRRKAGSNAASEAAFWPLLERPILFVWKVILEEASRFLQARWSENVIAPTQGLSKMEQMRILYGPEGKIRAFVDQFVAPFLANGGSRLKKVLDEALPLAPAFLHTLQEKKQIGPLIEGAPTHQIQVAAAGNSRINSETNIVESKTELRIECAGTPFTVVNRPPGETAATINWSYTTCGDVVITIFISCNRSCVERAADVGMSVPEASDLPVIVKRYTGQDGFLRFLQDFNDGVQTFRRADFIDSDEAIRQYGLDAITVYYRVTVPSTVGKLLYFVLGSTVPPTIVK